MIPRPLLAILVFALPILTVVFLVVAGGYILLSVSSDVTGANVLRWIAIGLLMLIASDVVLIVGALGLDRYVERNRPSGDSET